MDAAIDHVLRAPPLAAEQPSVADWWPRWRDGGARAGSPAAMAVLGGFAADRIGWAFAAGYQAALRRLRPQLPADAVAAFCVTEEGGNRPRDIATTIAPDGAGGWRLDGAKRWTTLGPASSLLLVVGRLPEADPQGRPRLAVAPVAALLPGDGYDAYVKPFRTIEDLHVTLAVLAYLLREARAGGWPEPFAERLAATMALFAALSDAAADAPATHVALAGALQLAHALYDEAGTRWAQRPDEPAAQRWTRDAALFAVAGSARERRAERAWQRLRAG